MIILKSKHNLVVSDLDRKVADLERKFANEEKINADRLIEIEYLEDINANRLALIDRLQKDLSLEIEANRNNQEVIATSKIVIEKFELKNCELNTKLLSEEAKVNQLETANHQLHQELVECEEQIKQMEEDLEKHRKAVDDLGKIYNAMNRKLWANHEAQRQLRNLSVEVLECERIHKGNLSKYLQDLSMLIGGGEEFEYAGLKINTEEEVVG